MKILIVEPFYGGSHRQWMDEYQQRSQHDISFLTLPARHWKWRMHGGAITLAEKFNQIDIKPELIIVSDFLDLTTFKSILHKELCGIPICIYFHENQITYPWSPADQDVQLNRDRHYGFINYTSALVADWVLFNSAYHKQSFLFGLKEFLRPYPDHNNLSSVDAIRAKSDILHLGIDLHRLNVLADQRLDKSRWPILLWNHRWEYDKNPDQFFNSMIKLKERGVRFNLIVLGQSTQQSPDVFKRARAILEDEILHWGYCADRESYAKWLWMADILPVTSYQDFFGISVIEAVYCDTIPLLPKRLAYTEHFPAEHQQRQFFYEDERDFLNKLQRYCFDVSILRKQSTQQTVEHYDWSVMSDRYDQFLSSLMKEYESR